MLLMACSLLANMLQLQLQIHLLTCLLFLSDSCSFIVDLCDIDNIIQVNLKALGF